MSKLFTSPDLNQALCTAAIDVSDNDEISISAVCIDGVWNVRFKPEVDEPDKNDTYQHGFEIALALVALTLHETGGADATDEHYKGWDSAVNEIERDIDSFKDQGKIFMACEIDKETGRLDCG